MIKDKVKLILKEVSLSLEGVKDEEIKGLIREVLKSKKIVGCGAGRVGMSARALMMRLSHLGFQAFFLGDSNVPRVGKGDLLFVSSGSGETETIFQLAKRAKKNGVRIGLVTANRNSRIGRLADVRVLIKAPTKVKNKSQVKSVQPMTSLIEQAFFILYDAIVLELMRVTDQQNRDLLKRHSILE